MRRNLHTSQQLIFTVLFLTGLNLLSVLGQDHPIWFENGATWHYTYGEGMEARSAGFERLEVTIDTVIKNIDYKIIERTRVYSNRIMQELENLYLRHDLENDQVYRFLDSTEYLLYDFSAEIGDTIIVKAFTDVIGDIHFCHQVVDSIKNEIFSDSIPRKVQYLSPIIFDRFHFAGKIIEGIGSESFFLPIDLIGCDAGCADGLRCYQDSKVVITHPYLECEELFAGNNQDYIPMNFYDGIWIESYFEKGGYEEKIQKFCNGDTTVDGMLFHKLYESKVVFPVYYPDTIENIFLGLIGNSDDRTVLYIPKGKDTATEIYDFNINIGDTIRGALHFFVVHEIDSIEICGRMHKRYCQEGVEYLRATLVEGVGFSNGLLGFFDDFDRAGETVKSLECYFEKSNPDCSDCNYIIGYLTKELRLVIYPNPVDNQFYIEAPVPITSIRIYNLMGSEVFNKKVDSDKSAVLKIADLTPGQYIIRVVLNDSSVISSTFFKN